MNLAQPNVIEQQWFARPATDVAPDLIGCVLVRHCPNGELLRGTIVETEAYGPGDPACHAYRKRTTRNAVMFGPAGYSYVYLIYGMYHCFNVVTDREGVASAVLIRALALPDADSHSDLSPTTRARLAAGPGKLCRWLEIDRSLSQVQLVRGQPLWIEHPDRNGQQAISPHSFELVQTTRIGLTQGAEIPWRWYLKGSAAVSRL
ncbi:DNA-3-methyladenine glycosylase [Altericista sp. CCNU0014]|uniref:DNA-3-methyladenine glycosylase n=1 Tax=Altericista sp. CCNU0014 TaxID=3082949 RepID=UPI0038505F7A